MLFCQMARADSLREISNGLKCCLGKLRHLGLTKAPPRSTLSYANAHRPAELFRDLFYRSYKTADWDIEKPNSASKTSCCHSTPPPFPFASSFSTGRPIVVQKAASRSTRFSTTTRTPTNSTNGRTKPKNWFIRLPRKIHDVLPEVSSGIRSSCIWTVFSLIGHTYP